MGRPNLKTNPIECKWCGARFLVSPHAIQRKYCGFPCSIKDRTTKTVFRCLECDVAYKPKPKSRGQRTVYCSASCASKKRIGTRWPAERRIRSSSTHKARVSMGLNHLYKGGITEINKSIRSSIEYKIWRTMVFERDDYTCCWCGKRGVALQADHIKPFAYFPKLRFAVSNGRTLCVGCHKNTDSYLGKAIKNYCKIK